MKLAYRDGSGWHQPSSPIVQYTTNFAFMPALDYNASGNLLVTYYYQPSAGTYSCRPYQALVNWVGTRIDASGDHDLAVGMSER